MKKHDSILDDIKQEQQQLQQEIQMLQQDIPSWDLMDDEDPMDSIDGSYMLAR